MSRENARPTARCQCIRPVPWSSGSPPWSARSQPHCSWVAEQEQEIAMIEHGEDSAVA
jgi:hypothetical protein